MFLDVIKEQAKIFGVDPDKLHIAEKQRNPKKQLESLRKLVSEKINEGNHILSQQKQHHQQSRIVTGEDDLLVSMNEGCEIVKELSGNRFLVR